VAPFDVVHILGCGNSAGQGALLLCQHARKVTIVAVKDSLEEMMSKYLVDRIRAAKNIVVSNGHTVVGAEGGDHLEWLTIQNVKTACPSGWLRRACPGGIACRSVIVVLPLCSAKVTVTTLSVGMSIGMP
jgi:hypothetical protein